MHRRNLSRRTLLTGGALGAGLMGLPLLTSLRRAGAQQDVPPRRFVFVYTPNGTVPEAFWPTMGAGGARDFELGPVTAPLAPFKERLLFLKGVDLAVTGIGPGGPHQRGMGALLTGRELQPGEFVGGDGSLAGWANGQSLDQAMAESLSSRTLFGSLELGVRAIEAEVRGRISYAAAGAPLPPMNSPLATYERVFSGVVDLAPETKDRRRLVTSALQQLYGGIAPRLSLVDQAKFEQHQDALRSIERRLGQGELAALCTSPGHPPDLPEDDENSMVEVSKLQFDLLAAAMACDLTRVATVQLSTAINALRFPWVDSLDTGHNLSHAGDSDTDARQQLVTRNTWHAEQIAHFLAALDAVPEGDGTLLDNTVVVWGNELGVGNVHSLQDIPFVLAGGAGGYFDMGRALEFDHVPHNQLLVSLGQAMGLPIESFGHPDFAAGALPGLTG